MNYGLYTPSGRIHMAMSMCSREDAEATAVLNTLEVAASEQAIDATTMYVLDGVIEQRQDYVLNALPLPCTVTLEGVEYPITEQPTFEFNYPGTYTVSVDAGPRYLKKEFEIVWP